MKKEEYIKKYGEKVYLKYRKQTEDWKTANHMRAQENKRKWAAANVKKLSAKVREWRTANPEKALSNDHEACRKEGRRYEHYLKYNSTGLRGKRNNIRRKHRQRWGLFKQIIAPNSQIHHEWIPETADYRGVALVETDPHLYGFIDVIQILEGEITLLTEKKK